MTQHRPQKVICILGMHRSGTSCLTGSLQNYGLDLGDYSEWNPHNKRGNRENNNIVSFHDTLLADNGGSWDAPPKRVVWQEKHFDLAKEILAKYSNIPVWGFKDPRTLLALDGWKKLIPNMIFVGIYRHPSAVAQSLSKRGLGEEGMTLGLKLWSHYNKQLLKQYKKHQFPILSFDWDETKFHRELDRITRSLDLEKTSDERFFTQDLVNNARDQKALPWRIRRLYKKLITLSDQQKQP